MSWVRWDDRGSEFDTACFLAGQGDDGEYIASEDLAEPDAIEAVVFGVNDGLDLTLNTGGSAEEDREFHASSRLRIRGGRGGAGPRI